jgi:hypothetical protein
MTTISTNTGAGNSQRSCASIDCVIVDISSPRDGALFVPNGSYVRIYRCEQTSPTLAAKEKSKRAHKRISRFVLDIGLDNNEQWTFGGHSRMSTQFSQHLTTLRSGS